MLCQHEPRQCATRFGRVAEPSQNPNQAGLTLLRNLVLVTMQHTRSCERSDSMADESARDPYALRTIPGFYASKPGIQIGTSCCQCSDEISNSPSSWRRVDHHWPERSRDHHLESYVPPSPAFWGPRLKIYRISKSTLPERARDHPQPSGARRAASPRCSPTSVPGRCGHTIMRRMPIRPMESGAPGKGLARGRAPFGFPLEPYRRGLLGWHTFSGSLTHGAVYFDELWDNYVYFIGQVCPSPRRRGSISGCTRRPTRLSLGGVPRCIFGNLLGLPAPWRSPVA